MVQLLVIMIIHNEQREGLLSFTGRRPFNCFHRRHEGTDLDSSLVYNPSPSRGAAVSNHAYTWLAGCPCFATVNLYLLRKVKALNFSLLLHYYVNSRQLLNYVYIDFCPRRRLRRMCSFKKAKPPCRMRGIPSNIHQVINQMDYN